MNYEADYRTAPATPGLLNILEWEDHEGVEKVYKAQKKNPSQRLGD